MCRRIGRAWLYSGKSCLLIVPSAVNPHEPVVLINPHHADIAKIAEANRASFQLDDYRFDTRIAEVIDLAAKARAG
jgi:RES domain-containing protein